MKLSAVAPSITDDRRTGLNTGHRANRDCLIDHDGAFLNRSHTENGDLRLMNDRRAEETAESAMVCNRERTALHFLRVQFLRPCTFGEIGHFVAQLRSAVFRSACLSDRDKEAILQCHCNTDMYIAFLNNAGLAP